MSGQFDGDHTAKRDTADVAGLAGVDSGRHSSAVVGERFPLKRGNPAGDDQVRKSRPLGREDALVGAHARKENKRRC